MTSYWAPLIHIYQPPTQDVRVLRKIDEECYNPLFKILRDNQDSKFSLNINGILIEMLYQFDLQDTMTMIKDLVSEKKIEILGTAKYHPILPLIPKKEARRQIRMNEEVNLSEFGRWERKGFFPPELAIDSNVLQIVRELGYKWIIAGGIACPSNWPYDKIYRFSNDLEIFFRDDVLSNKIAFKDISPTKFVTQLKNLYNNNENKEKDIDTYVITAMDGETFGHHIKNYQNTFLKKVLELVGRKDDVEIVFISELDAKFPIDQEKTSPLKSSWSTSHEDIKNGVPYPLWNHPENQIHVYYWKIINSLNKLMEIVDNLDLTESWDAENYYNTARWFYDRGLHSCPMWWANPVQNVFSPNLIYNGLELLIKAGLNAQLALSLSGKDGGDAYFDSITYYHGLILMELYSVMKKTNNKA